MAVRQSFMGILWPRDPGRRLSQEKHQHELPSDFRTGHTSAPRYPILRCFSLPARWSWPTKAHRAALLLHDSGKVGS